MLGRLNHVALAVPDLAAATATYRTTLGARLGEPQALPEHGVTVVFVDVGNTKIELLEPLGEGSPIAAFLVRRMPPRLLGSLVGGIIVITNTRTLLTSDWLDASAAVRYPVYGLLYAVWALAVVHSYRQYRKERALEAGAPNVAEEQPDPQPVASS